MPTKRSKDQIIAEILTLCKDGANKTRIVYQVNLNFDTANPRLDLLQKKGLLEAVHAGRTIYKTTPAGERILESLRVVEEIYS